MIVKINNYYVVKEEFLDLYSTLQRIMKDVYGDVDTKNIEIELYYEEGETKQYDVFYLEEQIAIVSIFPDKIEKQVVINYEKTSDNIIRGSRKL